MYTENNTNLNWNRNNSSSNYSAIPEINILNKLFNDHYYKNDENDVIGKLSKENHYLKRSSLNQIINMAYDRINERNRHIYEIDNIICDIHSKQFQLDTRYSDMNKRLNTSLDQVCSKLEIDKTKARIDAWQDITKLRKELIPLITEYLTSLRKMKILQNGYSKPYNTNPVKQKLPKFPIRIP